MKKTLLNELLEAQKLRKQVVVLTKVRSGHQELIYVSDKNNSNEALQVYLEEAFRSGENKFVTVEEEDVFLQVFNPLKRLIIIGAVHISQKLVPMAQLAGYETIIIDPRGAFANDKRFPEASIINEWPQDVLENYKLDKWTAFAALTHDPKIDDPALKYSLNSDCFYIGALGSKKTNSKRRARLLDDGVNEDKLDLIHAPIGLDIYAKGAAEISISIMAEITACFWQGRSLA